MHSTFRRKFYFFLLLLSPTLSWAQAPEAITSSVTLRQCYEWAQLQSETLQIRKENIEQARARGRQALGTALPDVRWKMTDTWQDPNGVEKLEAKGFSGFVEKEQVESRFTAQQTLFSGLRDFSAVRGAKHQTERDRLLFEKAERELFNMMATAFYTVVGFETDRTNTANALALADDRVKELRGFLKLGKSRDSEVFTAQAHAAALRGELDRILGEIFAARQELSFLTGHDLSQTPLFDEEPVPAVAPALDAAVAKAKDRTDLRAQREEVEAQRLTVSYQRGYYWPHVDITGNYYTERATFLKDIDWDVILDIDVPIFQGGQTAAAVREAASIYRQSKFMLQLMERRVAFDVRKLHGQLEAAIQEVQSSEEAAKSARRSYDALLKESRYGLVTNLDVLQALDFLQEQEDARDGSRLKAKRLLIALKVATEELP